jgi:integrase
MRLPNGYGSVYKLSGNRRNPYIARKTTGWDENKKQTYITIGYYPTKKEALQALADYNANPYDIEVASITFADVFAKWSKDKFNKISESNVSGYKASYALCQSLYNMRMIDIKASHLQSVIDTCGKNYPTLRKLRVLFSQLYKFSMANDIVDKDYSQFVDIGKYEGESKRSPFSKTEIETLWERVGHHEYLDTILIMIYTGLRIGELLELKSADVHLDKRYMRGGLKTQAGKNRIIPINRKIEPFIKSRLDRGHEFLITKEDGTKVNYYTYKDNQFGNLMKQLGMQHLPHDCRHTFATLMDNAGANKLAIKRIMGHASPDVTDKVYTHKDIEELIKAIDLI